MNLRRLMDLWQRRGETFGRRSGLLQRGVALQSIMNESLVFLRDLEGPVLDVGCGDGVPTSSLVQHFRVIGVDFALTMLTQAKASLPSADFLRASIDHLPLRHNVMSAVTCYFVLSDYAEWNSLLRELWRVLLPHGRLVLADYSLNDDFNNLLDDLQRRVLGKSRDMFRLDPDSLSREVEKARFKVRTSREIHHPLRIQLDTFVDQLYLSSAGAQYKEKQLSEDQWRRLLERQVEGSEVLVTRKFALVLAEKTA